VALVGGKNASLGEMYRGLRSKGILVPNGFAVTADAYRYVLDRTGAREQLRSALHGLDPSDVGDLAARGQRAREIVYQAGLPADLQADILAAHHRLREEYGAS
jgi:pyruvate,water dikinase